MSFQGGHHLTHRMHAATSGILPRKFAGGDSAYDAHCHAYGRTHAHHAEYRRRLSHFTENLKFIAQHNTDGLAAFEVGMNHFGDWSDEEFESMKQVSSS